MAPEPQPTLANIERVRNIVLTRAERIWSEFGDLPPDALYPPIPRLRVSELLIQETRSFVSASFGLAGALGRGLGQWDRARAALRRAFAMIERTDAYLVKGIRDAPLNGIRKCARSASLHTPHLLLRVALGKPTDAITEGWSAEAVSASIRDGSPPFPEVFHLVRAIVRRDPDIVATLRAARRAGPPRGQRWERGMHRWFDAIENTVEACLSGDVGVGASSLAEQLVVYGDLGRTYREPTEEWIARLPELHLELSIDWAAVAICRSVEGLAAAVAPLPGFLPEALVVDG